ncbi:MAG: IPT/TIG domain-containing protein [Myxococcota bacterium]
MEHRTRRRAVALATVLLAAGALAGCPDIPHEIAPGPSPDASGGDVPADGDVFVPLGLDRVHDNRGEPTGGQRVSVYGAGFAQGAIVTFGDAPATGVLVLDDGQINCDVPAHDPGLVDVGVELPDGQAVTLPDAFLYESDLEITAVEPTVGPVTGGVEITVTGEGFTDATRILVGGRMLEDAKRLDGETFVGALPARLRGRAGPVHVIATDGFEQRTLVRAFRYVDDLRLTWLDPAAGSTGGGGVVTLYGSGLDAEATASVGGTLAEIVEPGDGGRMTIRVPPGDAGPADVAVEGRLASRVAAGAFTYVDDPEGGGALSLDNVWPRTAPTAGGTQVVLTVGGLTTDAVNKGLEVLFAGQPATLVETRPDHDVVVVAVPPGAAGPATVTLESGADSLSRADLFSYEEHLRVDAVSPGHGSPSGGQEATLQGVGFTGDLQVLFGGREAPQTTLVSASELRVEVPPGVPGRVDVRLADGSGREHVVPGGYTYRTGDDARLLAVAPPDGSRSGGRLVRLYGTGFDGGGPPGVLFGDAPATDVTVVDDATLWARAPRGDVGAVIVDAGDPGRLAMAYDYFDPTATSGGTHGGTIPEALNVTVLDAASREPVDQAFVMLWDDLGTPYQAVTDHRGQVTFSDAGFGPPQMVTASKDGYTTASIVDFDARNATLTLVPLVTSPPSSGPPGPGPQPLPDGVLEGEVKGFEKYVLPPLGRCDAKLESGTVAGDPADLCEVCEEDADCGADGACTLLGEQGRRCTTACEVDADCPSGFVCANLGGAQGIRCVPSPGEPAAYCGTTIPDVFTGRQMAPGGFTGAETVFRIDSRPGEKAIVCMGGYLDPDTGDFVPLRMGVRRHVFVNPGDTIEDQDVTLDIPLTRTLRIRLDDPPKGEGEARNYEVDVYLDLGSDGVFPMPQRFEAVEQELVELEHFPAKFEESLYDASYVIFAGAYTDEALEGTTNTATFTLHRDITAVNDDAVFEVLPDGALVTSTGITHDVLAMHGPGDGHVWAVGEEGSVLIWDGTWWGLQQAPTDSALRAVWARTADDVWAAGDDGTILRWDGLAWTALEPPEHLADASWHAMHGESGTVWLLGDAGLWRFDGESWDEIATGGGSPGALRDVWSGDGETLWLVGDGGRIRRVTASGVEEMDVPGDDLLAVGGAHAQDVWAVGRRGRIVHWDGEVWFDYLPRTRRDLRAVHAVDPARVWAVGDAGAIVGWDGLRWTLHTEVPHVDLRDVRVSGDGRVLTGGRHTLVIGPFLGIPEPDNPDLVGGVYGLDLSWRIPRGPDADFTYAQLTEGSGFPFWTLMVAGGRTRVPLPDLDAAWGLQAVWPGAGFLRLMRVTMPGFDIDSYDTSQLSQALWRSWAQIDLPANWPSSAQ